MKKQRSFKPFSNSSGFIIADFLFAFVLVISISIFIFGLTFSLATVEIAQYIVWTTARNYASGTNTEAAAQINARTKFSNITAAFPSLTGNGSTDPWFELLDSNLAVGDLSGTADTLFSGMINSDDKINRYRQPWTGASAKIYLKLFAGFKIPFLGNVAADKQDFEFPLRAFIIRNPSQEECRNFFYNQRYSQGILTLEGGLIAVPIRAANFPAGGNTLDGLGEDNGC